MSSAWCCFSFAALIWANSSWQDSYASISEVVIGPAAVHLMIDALQHRHRASRSASMAILFFVVGVELKHKS